MKITRIYNFICSHTIVVSGSFVYYRVKSRGDRKLSLAVAIAFAIPPLSPVVTSRRAGRGERRRAALLLRHLCDMRLIILGLLFQDDSLSRF